MTTPAPDLRTALPPDPHDTPAHDERIAYDGLDRPAGDIELIELLPVGCPVASDSIKEAARRFKKQFPGREKLHERVDRAVEILEKRDERLEFQLERHAIIVQGGAKPYNVQANQYLGFTCQCRDYWVARRQQDHLGMCKHILAVELLRDAERIEEEAESAAASGPVRMPEPEPEPEVKQLARVDIAGRDLFAMLGQLYLGCVEGDEQSATLYISREGFLSIDRGRHSNILRLDTAGGAFCGISAECFNELWSALRPGGVNLPTLGMGVFHEKGGTDGLLIVKGGSVDLVIEAQVSPA